MSRLYTINICGAEPLSALTKQQQKKMILSWIEYIALV